MGEKKLRCYNVKICSLGNVYVHSDSEMNLEN